MDAHHEMNRRNTVMKRAIVIALSVILALVVAAPTVLAQEEGSPNGVPPGDVSGTTLDLPPQDDTDLTSTASFGCDFPVHIELTGKAKTIELPDGGFIATSPGLDATVRNEATGEEVTFNITGSIHGTPRPDDPDIVDYVITGRNLALDPAGLFLNKGRFTYTLDESEAPDNIRIVTPQEGKGQAIDVCALLS
jgi:hypothetical protein